jgi:hypothetical protein
MVREKLAEQGLLGRSPCSAPEDHLMKLVAASAIADPNRLPEISRHNG